MFWKIFLLWKGYSLMDRVKHSRVYISLNTWCFSNELISDIIIQNIEQIGYKEVSYTISVELSVLLHYIFLKYLKLLYLLLNYHQIQGLSGKSTDVLNKQEWFSRHWCNLAAKENDLEFTCVNNDDVTVLVSGDGRLCWESMCTVWLSQSEWLREESNGSASNFELSLNIPL